MSHQSELIAEDIEQYLRQHERKELLRLLTCGSVDDGKSTLIGRLLYDSKMIFEDQLAALESDSRVHGTTGGGFDPALLTDGLKAEREQGITIDVAYRYFSTAKRKFIIADTPGHEQYTRNMATGASNCDLAIILVDARHGVVTQTRRHSFIVSLLGIRHVVVAINKMDLVDFSEEIFDRIRNEYTGFAARLEMDDIHFIPISALNGDNVVEKSKAMPWYGGSTLMHMLENVTIASDRNLIDFRFPVQYVNRPHLDFRGYCGSVASGVVRKGDAVMVLPSRRTSRVAAIVSFDGELAEAFPPAAVTLTLTDEIDASRGDTFVHPGNQARLSDDLEAMLVWMSEEPLVPGRRYLFKHAAKTVSGSVRGLRYRIDVNSLGRHDAEGLALNEIGRANIVLNEALAVDPYKLNRSTGAFIMIDPVSNATLAAGMVLERAREQRGPEHWDTPAREGLQPAASRVSLEERCERFGQTPATVLITGLSGSGKSTVAFELERMLFDRGQAVTVLDGENLRLGLSRDLGFTESQRSESLRRAAEMARVFNDSGLICLCAVIAPEAASRERMARVVGEERFHVVYLNAPLAVCRERDATGLYERAERGELQHVAGVGIEYQEPVDAALTLASHELPPRDCASAILELLRQNSVV
jgi:bifunctional enzyme CysN/CysC